MDKRREQAQAHKVESQTLPTKGKQDTALEAEITEASRLDRHCHRMSNQWGYSDEAQ
jgi:hypothetical protein